MGRAGKRQKWYNIVVEKIIEPNTKGTSGFDSDILGWNIPEEVALVLCQMEVLGLLGFASLKDLI